MADLERKRKRESFDDLKASQITPSDEESFNSAQEDVVLEDQYFTVKVLKNSNPPKRAKTKGKSKAKQTAFGEVKIETLPGSSAPVHYQILPGGEWDSLKKYKNFVVQEKTFGIDDYVFIRHNDNVNDLADDGQGWVGKVLEIRARDSTAVYVRIFWLYWQAELPMGKQPYHGEKELIMSDFMQIIDAQTVDGKVDVEEVSENKHDSKPATGYYWRQNYFHLQNKLSDLKVDDCICRKPHNPDTLLVQCENCDRWQHELCIRDDVLRKKWDSMHALNGNTHSGGADLPTPPSMPDTITLPTRNGNTPAQGSKKKGARKSLSKAAKAAQKATTTREPWEDILEGILERDEQTLKDGDEEMGTSEDAHRITGRVVITDKRDKSGSREHMDATCLHCSASLAAQAQENSPGDEGAFKDDMDDKIEVA